MLNPSKANYDPKLTEAEIFKSVNIKRIKSSITGHYPFHLTQAMTCTLTEQQIAVSLVTISLPVLRVLEQMLTCNLYLTTTSA